MLTMTFVDMKKEIGNGKINTSVNSVVQGRNSKQGVWNYEQETEEEAAEYS